MAKKSTIETQLEELKKLGIRILEEEPETSSIGLGHKTNFLAGLVLVIPSNSTEEEKAKLIESFMPLVEEAKKWEEEYKIKESKELERIKNLPKLDK